MVDYRELQEHRTHTASPINPIWRAERQAMIKALPEGTFIWYDGYDTLSAPIRFKRLEGMNIICETDESERRSYDYGFIRVATPDEVRQIYEEHARKAAFYNGF